MPPRFKYWTIIVDGAPTAFRAAAADELIPTLRQFQRRHPEAALRWFEGGRLWSSPQEAQLAARRRRASVESRRARPRPPRRPR